MYEENMNTENIKTLNKDVNNQHNFDLSDISDIMNLNVVNTNNTNTNTHTNNSYNKVHYLKKINDVSNRINCLDENFNLVNFKTETNDNNCNKNSTSKSKSNDTKSKKSNLTTNEYLSTLIIEKIKLKDKKQLSNKSQIKDINKNRSLKDKYESKKNNSNNLKFKQNNSKLKIENKESSNSNFTLRNNQKNIKKVIYHNEEIPTSKTSKNTTIKDEYIDDSINNEKIKRNSKNVTITPYLINKKVNRSEFKDRNKLYINKNTIIISRVDYMINLLNERIQNIKFDPILVVLSSNEILYHSFLKRLLELYKSDLNSEKEDYISDLLIKNEYNEKYLFETNNENILLKEELISLSKKFSDKDDYNHELLVKIEKELEQTKKDAKNYLEKFTNNQMTISSLLQEIEMLKTANEDLGKEINFYKNQVSDLKDKLIKFSSKCNFNEEKNFEIKNVNENLMKEIEIKDNEIERLNRTNLEFLSENEKIYKEIFALKQLVNDINEEKQILNIKLSESSQ